MALIKLTEIRPPPSLEALIGMEIGVPPSACAQSEPDPHQSVKLDGARPPPHTPPTPSNSALSPCTARVTPGQSASSPNSPPIPLEYWRISQDEAYTVNPRPFRLVTSTERNGITPQDSVPSWRPSWRPTQSPTTPGSDTIRTPSTPTLHNSPDKVRQITGHDVNVTFDSADPRLKSIFDAYRYGEGDYSPPPSPAASSFYSQDGEGVAPKPIPDVLTTTAQTYNNQWSWGPDMGLISPSSPYSMDLPNSPASALVDPLKVRLDESRLNEGRLNKSVYPLDDSRYIRSEAAQQAPWRQADRNQLGREPTPEYTVARPGPRDSREEYAVKGLYHISTTQIAASVRYRERRPEHPRPPGPLSERPLKKSLSFSTEVLHSQGQTRRGRRPSYVDFSNYSLGQRPPREYYANTAIATKGNSNSSSVGSAPEESRCRRTGGGRSRSEEPRRKSSLMLSPRSLDGFETVLSSAAAAAKETCDRVETGLQGLVAHAKRSASLLSRSERRKARMRRQIRVISQGGMI